MFDVYGDSRENLWNILAVVINLSTISSVCGIWDMTHLHARHNSCICNQHQNQHTHNYPRIIESRLTCEWVTSHMYMVYSVHPHQHQFTNSIMPSVHPQPTLRQSHSHPMCIWHVMCIWCILNTHTNTIMPSVHPQPTLRQPHSHPRDVYMVHSVHPHQHWFTHSMMPSVHPQPTWRQPRSRPCVDGMWYAYDALMHSVHPHQHRFTHFMMPSVHPQPTWRQPHSHPTSILYIMCIWCILNTHTNTDSPIL